MRARQSIRDIEAGGDVASVFLIGAASLQQSRNGPYWRLELRDATGRVEAKIWSPLSTAFSDLEPGRMAEVEGRAALYRDQIQVTINALRLLEPDEQNVLPLADFLPASPRPPADMLAELEALCQRVLTHEPWQRFALAALRDEALRAALLKAPAAKSIHHAYVGGLLEHTLSVAGLCLRFADHYPQLDRQTLFAAAIFHDIGKLEEMSGGLANDYTDAGRLLGHIVQGLLRLEPFLAASGLEPELALHFRHLIASHHGELEYGAARLPATPEAFALHYADNVDAKIAQCQSLFPARDETAATPGMEWSPWQNLLERHLCRAPRTPEPAWPEPPLAEPPSPEPALAEPSRTEPELPKPSFLPDVAPEPAVSEPAVSEPAHDAPPWEEPVVPESSLPEPASPEPPQAEPSRTEPSLTESPSPEPALPEPVWQETPAPDEPEPKLRTPARAAAREDDQCSLL